METISIENGSLIKSKLGITKKDRKIKNTIEKKIPIMPMLLQISRGMSLMLKIMDPSLINTMRRLVMIQKNLFGIDLPIVI